MIHARACGRSLEGLKRFGSAIGLPYCYLELCLITPRTTLNYIVSHYLVLLCTASCCLALPRTSSYWHALPPIAFYSASNCWPTAALECNGQAVWLTKPCPSVWTRIRHKAQGYTRSLCAPLCVPFYVYRSACCALGSADLQANLQEKRKRVKSGQIVELLSE